MVLNDKEKRMRKFGYRALFAAIILAAAVTDAAAGGIVAPELSPSTMSAGLALLAGGVLIARSRWRR